MKKISIFLLFVVAAFSLSACSLGAKASKKGKGGSGGCGNSGCCCFQSRFDNDGKKL